MNRVLDHYTTTYGYGSPQLDAAQNGGFYEPKVARMIFERMLEEEGVNLRLQSPMQSVTTEASSVGRQRLTNVVFASVNNEDTLNVEATVFIDATYEGDLMAAAGVPYRIGEDGKWRYNEDIAPPNDTDYLQVYNFRVTLTDDPNNGSPIPAPEGYDREDFRRIIDAILNREVDGLEDILTGLERRIPNSKADFNDLQGSPQSFRIYNTRPWADGDQATRDAIYERARYQALGMLYTLQNDPEITADSNGAAISAEASEWYIPLDEYTENENWSPALYVREARRMLGDRVFTEHDLKFEPGSIRVPALLDAIAIGDYSSNCHGVRQGPNGETIGLINQRNRTWPTRPFQVPYGVLVPSNVDGLLVSCAVSSSHIGFCALRMEPTWTALGEAAGTAGAQAVQFNQEVRDIDVQVLRKTLHEAGALTYYVSDVAPSSPYYRAVQQFGNLGFFQDLYPANAPADANSKFPGFNQWYYAFPNHDLKPNELLTPELAANWLEKYHGLPQTYKTGADSLLLLNQPMTRGEFLNRLLNDPVTSGLPVVKLPRASVENTYSHTLIATGDDSPYSFSFVDGTLPPGIQFTGNTIEGLPSSAGTYSFRMYVSGDSGSSTLREFWLTVLEGNLLDAEIDTYIQSGLPTTNFGQSDRLLVKNTPGDSYHREAFMRFTLPPSGALLERATLILTPAQLYTDSNTTHFLVSLLEDASDDWIEGNGGTDQSAENALTWDSPRPAVQVHQHTVINPPYEVGTPVEIDLTKLVQQTLAEDPAGILGLKFTAVEQGFSNMIAWASREYTSVADRPQLVLEFSATVGSGLSAKADTIAQAGSPNTNFGADSELPIKNFPGDNFHREAFMRFELPDRANSVDEAILWLTPVQLYSGSNNTQFIIELIQDSDDAWVEDELTWNQQRPRVQPHSVSISPPYQLNIPIAVDITKLVSETVKNDPSRILGLKISGVETGSSYIVSWASRESAVASHQPHLVIKYAGAIGVGTYHDWRTAQDWQQEADGYRLLDPDSDGIPNNDERIMGTDPLQFNLKPRLDITASGQNTFKLSFQTQTANNQEGYEGLKRYYTLQYNTNLGAEAWINLPNAVAIPADNNLQEIEVELGDALSTIFYRLKIWLEQ